MLLYWVQGLQQNHFMCNIPRQCLGLGLRPNGMLTRGPRCQGRLDPTRPWPSHKALVYWYSLGHVLRVRLSGRPGGAAYRVMAQ